MLLPGILLNTIQEYAWGSLTAIPELLGCPVSGKPQAELWMGAHPKAPSQVFLNGKWQSLLHLIGLYPEEILGEKVSDRFGGKLPYLYKILAAEKPLSIQAHPDSDQAREGFLRENRLGIPIHSPQRNFKDISHKPECLCALTRFWGLNGFRPVPEIIRYLKRICPETLKSEIDSLESQPDTRGLRVLFQSLLTMDAAKKMLVIAQAVSASASGCDGADPVYEWILHLYDEYPSDIGILFPAVLNLVCLEPEQAMFLSSGEPHAYLKGVGIELMANSDNVLRGGLTSKYMDIPNLINVLTFQERSPSIIFSRKCSETEWVYDTSAEEFCLSIIRTTEQNPHVSSRNRSIEILLCIQGEMKLSVENDRNPLSLHRGDSVMIPASTVCYHLCGLGVCYKASVPLTPFS